MPGGVVFMQSPDADPVEVWERIPAGAPGDPREEGASVCLDMVKIAREVASRADLQMRMQGIVLLGAFLKLTPFTAEQRMTDEQVYAGVEKALRKYFGKRGDRVVQDNLKAVSARLSGDEGNAAGSHAGESRQRQADKAQMPQLAVLKPRGSSLQGATMNEFDIPFEDTLPKISACTSSTSPTSTSASSAATRKAPPKKDLPPTMPVARCSSPPAPARLRDFSYIAPEIPRVHPRELHRLHGLRHRVPRHGHPRQGAPSRSSRNAWPSIDRRRRARCMAAAVVEDQEVLRRPKKKGTGAGGMFNIIIDPSKCKGCAECVDVCDDDALKMINKTDEIMDWSARATAHFKNMRAHRRSTSTTTCSST